MLAPATNYLVNGDTLGNSHFVSVVIPCRNELAFIPLLLESLYQIKKTISRMEVLFVDGMSSDGTKALLEEAARNHTFIKVIENHGLIVSTAMNLGIRSSRGEIVVRMDAHSQYPQDYVRRCINLLMTTQAGNAGGRFVVIPNGNGPWALPIARVTSSRFGVGNGAFRVGDRLGFVDTVPFGTFRRALFDNIGYFDERLTRNQDNEFNARIRKSGLKIAFDPDIRIFYRNQSNLEGLIHQAFFTGMWNVYTLWLHPYTFQWRRFIPALFVFYLAFLIPAIFLLESLPLYVAVAPLAAYAILDATASFSGISIKIVDLRTFITFAAYHLSYGSGTWFGILNLLSGHWMQYLGKPLMK